ncbi:MAG: hypothetical protein AAF611_14875 [Bacteroidota bacterium]
MKKHKKPLFSLNKTKVSNLNYLSTITGGGDTTNTTECETYQGEDCVCGDTASCKSSAFVPPTGEETVFSVPITQTNGLPGNTCC